VKFLRRHHSVAEDVRGSADAALPLCPCVLVWCKACRHQPSTGGCGNRYFCFNERIYAARSAASDGLRSARLDIFMCGFWMMACNDADVVVGLLAIAAKDGALVHPAGPSGVITWHRLQRLWASLPPSATFSAWAPDGHARTRATATTSP